MRTVITNAVYGLELETALRNNLRVPDGFDVDLIRGILKSAINYVESQTHHQIVAKEVRQNWNSCQSIYNLSFPPDQAFAVTLNGEDITANTVKYINGKYSYFKITDINVTDDDVVETSYQCDAVAPSPELENLIITVATSMYYNPEGLPVRDQNRINLLLNTYGI